VIFIFYPSHILGGAELLLIRLANDLYNSGYEVGIVDIQNGWISENINNSHIETIYIGKEKVLLPNNATLITTSNFIYSLDNYFERSNTKLLFWTVQPYNVIISMPYINRYKILEKIIFTRFKNFYDNEVICKPKQLLSELIKSNSIVAMDNACNIVLNKNYGLNYQKFLPVYVYSKNSYSFSPLEEKIQLVWLGRIDNEFKKYILIKLISDIVDSNFFHRVNLNIIGEGEGLVEVKKFCENLNNVNFLGTLRKNELQSVLSQANIGFAMGTSALDIANLGIPTILLDFSYQPINFYKYRWIFEAENYDLGRDIKLLSCNQISSMKSLNEVLNQLVEEQARLGGLCKDYVEKNHTANISLKKIDKYFTESNFSIDDLYNYMKYRPIWLTIRKYIKGRR
jgi:hypothetical protein